jgi:hypothetical protein
MRLWEAFAPPLILASFSSEYKIRQAKRTLYAYVVASRKSRSRRPFEYEILENFVVLTTTF